jgi:hypothetical protein
MAFPAGPTNGQEFTDGTGKVWTYDSTPGMWRRRDDYYVSATELGLLAGAMPPTTTYYGDIFLDDVTGNGEIWYAWDGAAYQVMIDKSLPTLGNSIAYTFTGADQAFTVPVGTTHIEAKIWGAGGGRGGGGIGRTISGGPGDYVTAILEVDGALISVGDALSVVVGPRGSRSGSAGYPFINYGFASDGTGISGDYRTNGGGGGLGGLFLGTGVVLVTDAARALVIAGAGGGSGECVDDPANHGGGGGGPTAGGQATMVGFNSATAGQGSGGAGYTGGGQHDRQNNTTTDVAGDGGLSFVHASALTSSFNPVNEATFPVASVGGQIIDPNGTGEAEYISPAGRGRAVGGTAGDALVVINYN